MNDFKFNKGKKNKIDDDIALFLSENEAKKLLNELLAIHQKHDFFETEKLKQPNANRTLITENPDLSKLERSIIKEWEQKKLNGLSLLFFAKHLHAVIYSEFLGYKITVNDMIKEQITQNIESIAKSERKKIATNAANTRHKNSKAWKEDVCKTWNSGKYPSKNKCAEEESKRLGLSSSIVREYLKKI